MIAKERRFARRTRIGNIRCPLCEYSTPASRGFGPLVALADHWWQIHSLACPCGHYAQSRKSLAHHWRLILMQHRTRSTMPTGEEASEALAHHFVVSRFRRAAGVDRGRGHRGLPPLARLSVQAFGPQPFPF